MLEGDAAVPEPAPWELVDAEQGSVGELHSVLGAEESEDERSLMPERRTGTSRTDTESEFLSGLLDDVIAIMSPLPQVDDAAYVLHPDARTSLASDDGLAASASTEHSAKGAGSKTHMNGTRFELAVSQRALEMCGSRLCCANLLSSGLCSCGAIRRSY